MKVFPKELLEKTNVIVGSTFQSFLVRANTRRFWTQTKFNLYHEVSEGYAKLITELIGFPVDIDFVTLQNRISSLIGVFSMDPNRVIDVILETFEHFHASNKSETNIINFIKNYDLFEKNSVCQIIGNKFRFYQIANGTHRHPPMTDSVETDSAPDSLYSLVAALIEHKIVDIARLYPHLSPSDDELKESYGRFIKSQMDEIDKLRLPTLINDIPDGQRYCPEMIMKNLPTNVANQKF